MGIEEQMTQTILLTGGFGNIGGRLTDDLIAHGEVDIRLASRTIQHPPSWAPSADVVRLDLLDESTISAAVAGVSSIYHLAALNDFECAANPELAHNVNVRGTELLLSAAIAAGVERIVYMSTIHVYGSPLSGQISESTQTQPTHPYGVTHLLAERLITDAHQKGLIEGVVVRSANGFGVPMNPDVKIWQILVNDLCKQAIEFGALRLNSDGTQMRNFVTLTDLCAALRHVHHLPKTALGDGVFNVGSKQSVTVLEMASLIVERCTHVLGFTPTLTLGPPPEKPMQLDPLVFDCTKIQKTGFSAATPASIEIDGLLAMCKKVFGAHG
jgi:UDP-glucose 4-epimerase